MKNLMFAMLITAFTAGVVMAQETEEVYPQQSSIVHNDAVISFSQDYVITNPNNYLPSFFQDADTDINQIGNISITGNYNIAYLSQIGNQNIGMINIEGDNNEANLNQMGSSLYSNLNLIGNYNRLDVLQEGSDLQNYIKIGGNNLQFSVEQDNLGLELTEIGSSTIPISIQHTGEIIPIIIENN